MDDSTENLIKKGRGAGAKVRTLKGEEEVVWEFAHGWKMSKIENGGGGNNSGKKYKIFF